MSNVPTRFENKKDTRSPFQRGVISAWRERGGLRRGAEIAEALTKVAEKEEALLLAIERRDKAAISANKTRHTLHNMKPMYQAIDEDMDIELKKKENEKAKQQLKHKIEMAELEGDLDAANRKREAANRGMKFATMRDDFIKACGGFGKMTEEQKADLKRGEELNEEFMQVSGLS